MTLQRPARMESCVRALAFAPLLCALTAQAQFVDLVNLLHDAGLSYYGNLEQQHDGRGAPIFLDCAFVRPGQ